MSIEATDGPRRFQNALDSTAPNSPLAGGIAPIGPVSAGTAAAPAFISTLEREKRRTPRFKCEGNMELKTEGSTIRTWATFTDVSVTGCYVEMMTTFPVDTKVELQLGMNGYLVSGKAVVRVTYPFLGMGIEFTELSRNAREQLVAMVASLNRFPGRPPETETKKGLPLPPITEPSAALDSLLRHFEANPSLTANEFVRLVADSQQRNS